MQTFLPYPDFYQSALCLDNKRLNKQILEADQILDTNYKIIHGKPNVAWGNHPAVLMWRGYSPALKLYRNLMLLEHYRRGGNYDTGTYPILSDSYESVDSWSIQFPKWLGDERIHNSHKSKLLFKDPEWYGQYNWQVPDNLEYHWPVTKDYCPILHNPAKLKELNNANS